MTKPLLPHRAWSRRLPSSPSVDDDCTSKVGAGGVKVIHPSLGGRLKERRLGREHPQVLSSQAGQCQVSAALLKTSARLGRLCAETPDLLENKQPPTHRLLPAQTVAKLFIGRLHHRHVLALLHQRLHVIQPEQSPVTQRSLASFADRTCTQLQQYPRRPQ